MKLIIDLEDPEFQRQLQLAINQKVDALVAERINDAIDKVVATKIERLTEKHLDALAVQVIEERTAPFFSGYNSEFKKFVAEKVDALIKKHFTQR